MVATCAFLAWGLEGAADLLERESCALVVVIDVLSFSTTVSIAAARGISVVPAPPGQAESLSERLGMALAAPRRAGLADSPWSLSPSVMSEAPYTEAVVIASPNGAAISAAAAAAGLPVVAGCLRNRAAVATHLAQAEGEIALVAAGERYGSGGLRPAGEDLVGAGLAAALARAGAQLDPEAALAARAASLGPPELTELLRRSRSACELADRGFAEDVGLALAIDSDAVVPLLEGEPGFRPAASDPGRDGAAGRA